MDALYPITNAAMILNDREHVRWSRADMAEYLNQGVREVVRVRPDTTATKRIIDLDEGICQTLPAEAQSLITVERSIPSGFAVRRVSEDMLESLSPLWSASPPSSVVKDYTYDSRKHREFFVYPPAVAGSQLEISYSKRPEPISEPPEGEPWPVFPLPQEYADIVMHWILYRCLMVSTGGGSIQRAQSYYQQFYSQLGALGVGREEISPEAGS